MLISVVYAPAIFMEICFHPTCLYKYVYCQQKNTVAIMHTPANTCPDVNISMLFLSPHIIPYWLKNCTLHICKYMIRRTCVGGNYTDSGCE